MFNEHAIKSMMDIFANPVLRQGFMDFYMKIQKEGINEARKAWNMPGVDSSTLPDAEKLYEKMLEFYELLGFVPAQKYNEIIKENDRLKEENRFLKDTIRELQLSVFKEGGEKAQKAWQDILDSQTEMNREVAQNFFDMFKGGKK